MRSSLIVATFRIATALDFGRNTELQEASG